MIATEMETTETLVADIAVLDDDLDFRNYLEDFLKDEGGYTVRAFADPGELYDGCEQRVPDIVLLDMKMGEVSGDRVLEQLLTRWPGLCVIIITGYPSLEDMRATFKLKVFDYLSKPFSLAQLRHAIKMLRVERGWSLKDLALQTRLSVSQISSIERGANLPSIESLLAISKAFDKRPSDIL